MSVREVEEEGGGANEEACKFALEEDEVDEVLRTQVRVLEDKWRTPTRLVSASSPWGVRREF